jgi:hypothetical protein
MPPPAGCIMNVEVSVRVRPLPPGSVAQSSLEVGGNGQLSVVSSSGVAKFNYPTAVITGSNQETASQVLAQKLLD